MEKVREDLNKHLKIEAMKENKGEVGYLLFHALSLMRNLPSRPRRQSARRSVVGNGNASPGSAPPNNRR